MFQEGVPWEEENSEKKEKKEEDWMDYPEPASAAVARTIYDGRVWVDCGAYHSFRIPFGFSNKSSPLVFIDIEFVR